MASLVLWCSLSYSVAMVGRGDTSCLKSRGKGSGWPTLHTHTARYSIVLGELNGFINYINQIN